VKKIILSLAVIGAVSVGVIGGTRSFFSNVETSTGNSFTAGGIDLKVGNVSYYNGVASASSSWSAKDLAAGDLFFNFSNLMPGDIGENLVDLNVKGNDAYACMTVAITGTSKNGQTGDNAGELQNELHFTFWADNGDNVLESDEVGKIFVDNETLAQIASSQAKIILADSTKNVWNTAMVAGSMTSGQTYHIGKVFCYGSLTQALAAPGINDPTKVSGFNCNGTSVSDASQTDGVLGDISFTAIQSKNNGSFRCNPVATVTPTPTPIAIWNDNFGIGDDSNIVDSWAKTNGNTASVSAYGTYAKKPTTGDNSESPDNGRFALIAGKEWICHQVDATGLMDLTLSYYWRGDIDAGVLDNGVVEYLINGACDSLTGWTTLANHQLIKDDSGKTSWSALQTLNLPGDLNNTQFLIRFRSNSSSQTKSFRIDNVSMTGIPN